ncbi:YtzH-like family protein [Alteribacter aurantiacus]|uniref:YtzH-like family protein n=1 Tax=Alteribacter aurantiacus TaxID=254410 RepID=UPI00042225F0|nr:YtzH-like family protein [Alteribacter aurantiacus]
MPMNYHHQLQLLVDILKNQDTEHFGSRDEYAQIERLAKSLLKNKEVQHEVRDMLATIEKYSTDHQTSGQLESLNGEEIQQWIQGIETSEHSFLYPDRLM